MFYERYQRDHYRGSSADARRRYSEELLEDVPSPVRREATWLADKTVVTVGCGCTGDLAMWPAAAKIAIDPLLYAYQHLGMLVEDGEGTAPTIYFAMSGEETPLLDATADLVVCRNALDHIPDPTKALAEVARILGIDGYAYLSVDIGGDPTPDEPHAFSFDSVTNSSGST